MRKKLKIIFTVLAFSILLSCKHSSNSSESEITELEGSWISPCLEIMSSSGGTKTSIKLLKTFTKNNVVTYIRSYADIQCTQYISETEDSDFYLSIKDNSNVTFTIGDTITLNDGTNGTEIDFYLSINETILSVYQFQDNGLTLVFGLSCEFVPPFLQQSSCLNGRSLQIDAFSTRLTKI